MEDFRKRMTAIIAIGLFVLIMVLAIFAYEFTAPEGAFHRALNNIECGDGLCYNLEVDSCPVDCGIGSATDNAEGVN